MYKYYDEYKCMAMGFCDTLAPWSWNHSFHIFIIEMKNEDVYEFSTIPIWEYYVPSTISFIMKKAWIYTQYEY